MEMETTHPLPATALRAERAVRLLSQGHVAVLGQILASSNVIFLTRVDDEELQALAIYKPRQGERPLWDFPRGTLCLREVAAYVVSQALGWPLVPPTVLRDGPYGPGALQLYIDADPKENYFTFRQDRQPALRAVALFDALANNADRKGGHLLQDQQKHIWAIDNALTFHPEPKLRTVIWDFAGQPISKDFLAQLRRLQKRLRAGSNLKRELSNLLADDEIAAMDDRIGSLLENASFPHPDPSRRQIPWPIV